MRVAATDYIGPVCAESNTPWDLGPGVAAVSSGSHAIVPTRRWYMVCCDAKRADLCDEIFRAKRRRPDKSLLLVPDSVATVRELFEMTAEAESLMRALWPGDLALRLRWRSGRDAPFAGVGFPTSLVCVNDDALGCLAEAAGMCLAATSVNVVSPEDPGPALSRDEVVAFLDQSGLEVNAVVDGGICPAFQPLTIVECQPGAPCAIERRGAVHDRAIELALTASSRPS